jgi:sulfite reductase (NADPH) flavoprotein alpha-component
MSRIVSILYATVSGNAEELAVATAERLRQAGWTPQLCNVADFPAARLRETDVALILASTWGEGVPPPDAEEFCAGLADESLCLDNLRFAVFALGSSSYRNFCGCGKAIDELLEKRGAVRLLRRVDCDTKFKSDFRRWLEEIETALQTVPAG